MPSPPLPLCVFVKPQDAVKAVFLDRVTVVEAYDDVFVRSPTFEIQVRDLG